MSESDEKHEVPGPKSAIDSMLGRPITVTDEIGVTRNQPVFEFNTGRYRTSLHTVVQGYGE